MPILGCIAREAIRYAPSFRIVPGVQPGRQEPYTAGTLGRFLGWVKGNSTEPQNKVRYALVAPRGYCGKGPFSSFKKFQFGIADLRPFLNFQ
jgi:hypothetical protein